jgi:hypothetical protein
LYFTVAIVFTSVFSYYLKYDNIIDQKPAAGFQQPANIYAIPETVQVGRRSRLARSQPTPPGGYAGETANLQGSYRPLNNGIEIARTGFLIQPGTGTSACGREVGKPSRATGELAAWRSNHK